VITESAEMWNRTRGSVTFAAVCLVLVLIAAAAWVFRRAALTIDPISSMRVE